MVKAKHEKHKIEKKDSYQRYRLLLLNYWWFVEDKGNHCFEGNLGETAKK